MGALRDKDGTESRSAPRMGHDVPGSRVLPLHANLTSDEQRRVFAPTSEWKIVVSTNVAEVSRFLQPAKLWLTLSADIGHDR